jgi:hypothetical protein
MLESSVGGVYTFIIITTSSLRFLRELLTQDKGYMHLSLPKVGYKFNNIIQL